MSKSKVPKDLTQLNKDVIAALEKNGIKNPAVIVCFTEPSTNYSKSFWVSSVSRFDAIRMLKHLLDRMLSQLN